MPSPESRSSTDGGAAQPNARKPVPDWAQRLGMTTEGKATQDAEKKDVVSPTRGSLRPGDACSTVLVHLGREYPP